MSRFKKIPVLQQAIYNHINNNKKEYLITTILFFIGILIGVILFNNLEDNQIQNVNDYLQELFNKIKYIEKLNLLEILEKTFVSNGIIILLLWFGAATIIGIPIIYGTIIIKGFTVGYTISSIINTFGMLNGVILVLSLLFLQNIIVIPTIIATGVKSTKLYKIIVKSKNRENIKIEVLRYSIFCIFMFLLVFISALIETYISTNFTIFLLKYIKI